MIYNGQGISNGKTIARAVVIPELKIKFNSNINFDKEFEKKILESSLKTLDIYYTQMLDTNLNKDLIDLISFYKLLLSSDSIRTDLNKALETMNAVNAVEKVFNDKALELRKMDNEYMRARYMDILDVKTKLEKILLSIEDINLNQINYDYILIAKELTPSMLLNANKTYLKGIISEIGSINAHIGILARSLNIPAVFGIKDVENKFKNNDIIYLNGNGSVITELTENQILEYAKEIEQDRFIKESLNSLKDEIVTTTDGIRINIAANVGNADDINKLIDINVDGIGLFRTEFLFIDKDKAPSEEEQYQVYKKYALFYKNKGVIIRTLDIGGDKTIPYLNINEEKNSFLGLRGIRYCLKNKDIFKTQLRAILRASNYGEIMIMYPMISSIEEIRKADVILREAMNELDLEDISYNKEIKVGIMIETPAAVMLSDYMINEVDFFSIGTNDLVQYTLATDRTNNEVTETYDSFNPAVIRAIKTTIDSRKIMKFVGLCGEMGANPLYTILLVGMRIDEISVGINSILKVKKYISMLNYDECKKALEHVLTLRTGYEIKEYLKSYAKNVFGEYYNL